MSRLRIKFYPIVLTQGKHLAFPGYMLFAGQMRFPEATGAAAIRVRISHTASVTSPAAFPRQECTNPADRSHGLGFAGHGLGAYEVLHQLMAGNPGCPQPGGSPRNTPIKTRATFTLCQPG